MKRHHPQEFYVAALRRMPETKTLELLKDAAIKGKIEILNPSVVHSGVTWQPEGKAIRAGLVQIKGIGETMAPALIAHRESLPPEKPVVYSDFLAMRGVGQKKIESIQQFCEMDDPFEIHKLQRKLDAVRADLRRGIQGPHGKLPRVTHRTVDVPYSRGDDVFVTWCGIVNSRNLRDIFELHYSRTGEELDATETKSPELKEYMNLWATDETEAMVLTVDRFKYKFFKNALWNIKMNEDVILVQGIKKGFQSRRAVYINKLWVLGD